MSLVDYKDNPYISLVAKKHRNLKKKYEKILKIETYMVEGKVLDPEQRAIVLTKTTVEKSMTDLKTLLTQLEDVAKELQSSATTTTTVAQQTQEPTEETKASAVDEPKANAEVEPVVFESSIVAPLETTATVTSASVDLIDTSTPLIDVTAVSTDAAVLALVSPTVEPAEDASFEVPEGGGVEETSASPPDATAETRRYEDHHVLKLLKVLHVYARYRAITGDLLPEFVDFFGKTLMGETSLKKSQDTVLGSLRSALNYLDDDDECSQREVVRGVTYSQMSSVVDALCDAMDRSPVLNDTSFSMPIGSLEASVIAAAAAGSYGYQQGDHGGHGYRHVEPPMTVYNYGPPMVDGPGMMAYYAPPFDAGNYGYPPLVDAYRRLEPPPNMVYNSNYGPIVEAGMDNSCNASSPSTSTNRRSSPPKKNSKNTEIDREVVEGNRYTAQSLKISLSEGGEEVDGYGEEDKSLIPMNPMAAAAAKLSSKLDINFFATDDSTAVAADEESTTAATATTTATAVNEPGGEEESSTKHAKSRRTGGRFKRNRDTPTQPVSHATHPNPSHSQSTPTHLTPKINIASDAIAAIPSSQPVAHVEAQQASSDSAAPLAPPLVQAPHAQSTVPASSSSSQSSSSSSSAVPAIMGVEAALRYLSQPQQVVSTATVADGPYDRSGVDTQEMVAPIYAAGGVDQEKSKPSRGTKKTKRNSGKTIKEPVSSPADPQADVSEPIIIAASKVVDAPAVAVVVDEYSPRPGSIDGLAAADANEAVSVGFSTRRPRKRSSNKGQGGEARAASSIPSEATSAPTHQSHPPLSSSSLSIAKPTPDQQVLQGRGNDYPEGKSKGTNASSAWNSSSVGRTPSHHHQPEPIVSKSIGAMSVDAASKQHVEQQSHHSGDSSTQPPNYREGSSNLSSELSHSTSQPPSRGQFSQSSSSHRQGQLNHHTQSNNQSFNGQGPPNQSVNNKVGPAQPSTIQGATNQSANNQGSSSHFINNQVANGRYSNSRGPSTQAVASQGSYSHDSYNRVVRVSQPGPTNQPPSINARVPANQSSANHFTPPTQPTTHQSTSSSQPSINSRGPANQPSASSKVVPASYQSSNGNSGPSPQPVGSNGVVARNGNTQQQAGYTKGSQHTGYKDPQHAGNRSSNAPAVKQN